MGLSREYRVIDSERAANRHSKGVSWLTMRPLIACYGRVPVMPLPAAANDVHRDEAGSCEQQHGNADDGDAGAGLPPPVTA